MRAKKRHKPKCWKKTYYTWDAAIFFAKCDTLTAYQCAACGYYHLTSQELDVGVKQWKVIL